MKKCAYWPIGFLHIHLISGEKRIQGYRIGRKTKRKYISDLFLVSFNTARSQIRYEPGLDLDSNLDRGQLGWKVSEPNLILFHKNSQNIGFFLYHPAAFPDEKHTNFPN